MNQMLSLTKPQSLALIRLIRHLQAAWQEAEGEVVEEEALFSTGDLEELLLLLPPLERGSGHEKAVATLKGQRPR